MKNIKRYMENEMKDKCWLCNKEFETTEEKKKSKDLENHTCEECLDEKSFFLYEDEEEFFNHLKEEKDEAKLMEEDMEIWRNAQKHK